jgi:hypothetical protein
MRGSLLLAAVLGAGLVIGFQFGRTRPRAMSPAQNAMDSATMMRAFDRDLSLDSAQHASIAAVLGRRQAGIDSAWRALQPNVRAAMDSTQMEIVAILRPDQRRKFLALLHREHGGAGMPR